MELVIYAPTDDQFLQSIEFNYDELRQELAQRLTRYKDLVYTEGDIKTAKSDRAALNKFKEALEAKRREVKTQCLKPYEDFETKIKALVALADEPVQAIDTQVKSYEERVKSEKREAIRAYYDAEIGDLGELLPFDRLFNPKWLNVTAKLPAIQSEISERIQRVASDLKTISDLQTEFALQVKDVYLQTLDLSAALKEKTRLEERKKRMAEYEAQKAAQTAPTSRATIREAAPPAPANSISAPQSPTAQQPRPIDIRVWATSEQLPKIKQFFIANNIRYGRVI